MAYRLNIPPSRQIKSTGFDGDIEAEKEKWIGLLKHCAHYNIPGFIHDFFGKMTKEQVGYLAYKHTDHHLRQFGGVSTQAGFQFSQSLNK